MPIPLNPRLFHKDVEMIPTRYGYGDGVLERGRKNPNVVVLTADLAESTRVEAFREAFPERFIECGVAEQNMMGVAAGLALAGKIPFVSSYAVFVPGRCWDQLRVSVCYANANVKIAGSHAGISVGPDGATHQGLEDIALVRVLPNMTVVAPCDYEETRKCAIALAKMKGPAYMRLARNKTPVITTKRTPFVIGRTDVFAEGADVTIAACGPLLFEALVAANELRKNKISAEVLNCHTLKPFDEAALVQSVRKTGCCVTVEEHQVTGGLNGVVSEVLGRRHPVPVEAVGMPDCFGESGQPDELLKKYGMKAKDVVRAARIAMKRKNQ
jgi:transketolase